MTVFFSLEPEKNFNKIENNSSKDVSVQMYDSYVEDFKVSTYGGSTITQQVVKNVTQEKASSGAAGVIRKLKEWSKAYQIEKVMSKDQIIELYLNFETMEWLINK